ncbi:MAG: glycosyltransferase family 2 protein [Phototrophicaceae bacterium]
MVSISVVIPVYRGAQSIPQLMQDLAQELPKIADNYEVIMVEDDGGDNSWEVIQALSEKYTFLTGIKLMRNYGQHSALLCGIRASQYEVVVTMDDDLQHPPSEIKKLLAQLDAGYDVVYGTPETKQHNTGRNLGSFLIRFALGNAMGVDAARHVSAFRAFRTHLRKTFEHYSSPYVSLDVLLSWGTTRFGHTFVKHNPRTIGESGYTFMKLVTLAFTMLTGFSVLPLRLASYLGFALTLFGIALFIYIVPIRLLIFNSTGVPGFTFLASMISIFSGAQMFTIGIIGEYLARMHFRLMDKPPYTVYLKTNEKLIL